MAKLRFNISISLDGFAAGPNASRDAPLGQGGELLHEWVLATEGWRRSHGRAGGESGPDSDVVEESLKGIGAHLMGRNMFGGGPGVWGDDPWQGWWGDDPPFHTPVFVLTHHSREPLALGDTTFHFVTDGIESALEQAKDAAGGGDVLLGGGADVAQQYLAAGLIDEMELHVVPLLLGDGVPLFKGRQGAEPLQLERPRVIDSPAVTHLKYRCR
jgi:dihydrofolate reductase